MVPTDAAPDSLTQDFRTLDRRAEKLRRDFDNSFIELPRGRNNRWQAFLAIAVGRVGWALRMQDVVGIYRHKKITALPGGPRELLGLANIRGTLIPVYDLRVLLNADGIETPPSWLVITAPPLQVGLAFDHFDGYLQQDYASADPVQQDHLQKDHLQRDHAQHEHAPQGDSALNDEARQTLRVGAQRRTIVDLQPILESINDSIKNKTQLNASPGE